VLRLSNVINRKVGGLACWFEVSDDSLERLSYGCVMLQIVEQAVLPVGLRLAVTAWKGCPTVGGC